MAEQFGVQKDANHSWDIYIYIYTLYNLYIYTWNPFSVLIGKDHILGGWWSKIEVIQVLGIYTYVFNVSISELGRPPSSTPWKKGSRPVYPLGQGDVGGSPINIHPHVSRILKEMQRPTSTGLRALPLAGEKHLVSSSICMSLDRSPM